jgi:hypothetical protein
VSVWLLSWCCVSVRVTRDSLCMMEKSREHQEQNLQREYQGKNQELTRMLLETQMELANKVGRAPSAILCCCGCGVRVTASRAD